MSISIGVTFNGKISHVKLLDLYQNLKICVFKFHYFLFQTFLFIRTQTSLLVTKNWTLLTWKKYVVRSWDNRRYQFPNGSQYIDQWPSYIDLVLRKKGERNVEIYFKTKVRFTPCKYQIFHFIIVDVPKSVFVVRDWVESDVRTRDRSRSLWKLHNKHRKCVQLKRFSIQQ